MKYLKTLLLVLLIHCVHIQAALAQISAPTQVTGYMTAFTGSSTSGTMAASTGYTRSAQIYPLTPYNTAAWGWVNTLIIWFPSTATNSFSLNLKIRLANTDKSDVSAVAYDTLAAHSRLVKTYSSYGVYPYISGYLTIQLDTAFLWTGGNLLVLLENNNTATGTPAYLSANYRPGSGRTWQNASVPPTDTGTAAAIIPSFEFDFAYSMGGSCNTTAVNGPDLKAMVTDPDKCRKKSNLIFLDGMPSVAGYTYQWKQGPVGGPYVNVMTNGNAPCLPIQQMVDTTSYYCVVSCPANSTSVSSSIVTLRPYVTEQCYCTLNVNGTIQPAKTKAFELTGTALLDTTYSANYPNNILYHYSPVTNGVLPELYKGGRYTVRTRGLDSMAYAEAWIDADANGAYGSYPNTDAEFFPIVQHSSRDTITRNLLFVSDTMTEGMSMMRAKMVYVNQYNSAPNGYDACSNAGSTADYKVRILPRPVKNIAIQEIRTPNHSCTFSSTQQLQVLLYTNGTSSLNLATTPLTLTAQVWHNGTATTVNHIVSSGILQQDDTLLVNFPATVNMGDSGVYKIVVQVAMSGDAVVADNYYYDYYRHIPAKPLAIVVDSTLGAFNSYYAGVNYANNSGWSEGIDSICTNNINSDWFINEETYNAGAPNTINNQYHTDITLIDATTYSRFGWLMTPKFKVTPKTRIRFRAAATGTYGPDTKVYLRATGDCGGAWTNLISFDTASLASLNKEYDIPLSAFSGGQARVAWFVQKAGIFLGSSAYKVSFFDFTIYDVPDNDIEMRGLTTPYDGKPFYCGQDSVRVTFRNKGTDNLNCSVTPVTFKAYFRGNNQLNYTLNSGILQPYRDTTITIGTVNMDDVYTNAEFYVRAVCAADTFRADDTVRTFINLRRNPTLALPWRENFLFSSGVYNTTTVVTQLPWKTTYSQNLNWNNRMMYDSIYTNWKNDLGAFANGSAYARYDLNNGTGGGYNWMLTSKMMATPNTYINYSAGMFNNNTGQNCVMKPTDSFVLAVSIDCGSTWAPIMVLHDTTAVPYTSISHLYNLGQFAGNEIIVGFGVRSTGTGLGYLGIDWVEMDNRWRYNVKPIQYIGQTAYPLCLGTIYQDSVKVKLKNVGYDAFSRVTYPVTVFTTLDTGGVLQTFTKTFNTGTFNKDDEINAFMGMGHFSKTAVNHLMTYTTCSIDTVHSDDTLRLDITPPAIVSVALPIVNDFSSYNGTDLDTGWTEAVAGAVAGVPSPGNSLWYDSTFNHQAGDYHGTSAEFYLGQPSLPGDNREGWIITPEFVPDSATYLSFVNRLLFDSTQYNPSSAMVNAGYLSVKVLTNCGYNSSVLYTRYGNSFIDTVKSAFSLKYFTGQPIRIGFQAFYPQANSSNYPNSGRYLQLDDININSHPTQDLAIGATFNKGNGSNKVCADTAQRLTVIAEIQGYKILYLSQTPVQLVGTVSGPVSFSFNKTYNTGLYGPATSQSNYFPITFDTLTKLPVGNYTIKAYVSCVADSNHANDTIVLYRTVLPKPVVNLGNDTVICSGNQYLLNAGNPGSAIMWNNNPYSNSQTYPLFWGSTATTVQVTDVNGCSARDTINVQFDSGQWGFATDTIKYCGLSFGRQLKAIDYGGATQYLWSTGATTSSINVSAPGYYNVQQTGFYGCLHRDTVYVAPINNFLAPVNLGPDKAICPGVSTTLSPGPQTQPVAYYWSNNTNPQGNSISINTPATYAVKVQYNTNSTDTICYLTDTIVVSASQVPVVNLGPDTSLCYGASLILNAGNSGSTYAWNSGNGTGQTYTLTNTNSNNYDYQSNYAVTVTNPAGCTATDNIWVLFYRNAPISLGPDTTLCNSATLTIPSPPSLILGNYNWSTGSTGSSISVNSPGTYWVTAKYQNKCIVTDTVIVNTGAGPVLNLPASTAICSGDSTTIVAGLSAGTGYVWSTGSTDTAITVHNAGVYQLTATNLTNGCKTDGSTTLNLNPLPQVSLGPDVTACGSASYTIQPTAIAAGVNKLWSDASTGNSLNIANTGNYWLKVTDGAGCSNADSIRVTLSPLMTLTVTPYMGIGNNGSAKAQVNGGIPPYHYQWNPGNSTTDSISGLATGSYSVVVTDSAGCQVNTSFVIQNGTGVAENLHKNGMVIYPNPSHGTLYIKNRESSYKNMHVTLLDALGRVVKSQSKDLFSKDEIIELNLDGIAAGLYQIKLSADEYVSTVKVVIE